MLRDRFRADLRVYIEATNTLDKTAIGDEFEKVYRRALRAQRAFERARELLNKHMAEHGCR